MKRIKLFLSLLVMTCMLSISIGQMQAEAYNQDTFIIMAEGSTADGCTLVGVEGDFISEAEQALEMINQIREEACNEGVRNPKSPTKNLTAKDYVPLQWSKDMQEIAMIRAAEASRIASSTKPNGADWSTTQSSAGVKSAAEALAWTDNSSLLTAIEQWYGQKSAWVNKEDGAANYYAAMIDPSNTFVGLSGFVSAHGVSYNCISAEFSKASKLETEVLPPINNTIVVINVKSDLLSEEYVLFKNNEKVSKPDHVDVGDQMEYSMGAVVTVDGRQSFVTDVTDVYWTSSDEKIATVNQNGTVTIVGSGEVTIFATDSTGKAAAVTLTSAHSWNSGKTTTKATCTNTGVKTYTCKICGQTRTEKIAKVAHKYVDKISKASQSKDGATFKRCSVCKKETTHKVISKIASVKLAKTSYKYTGKEIKPAVTVTDSTGKKLSSKYYTVAYSNNKKVGTAKVTVTFQDRYAGSKKLTFTIKK